jgi:hypothetical protein
VVQTRNIGGVATRFAVSEGTKSRRDKARAIYHPRDSIAMAASTQTALLRHLSAINTADITLTAGNSVIDRAKRDNREEKPLAKNARAKAGAC